MSSTDIQARLGKTLVDFSSKGVFPEDEAVSAATLETSALSVTLTALEDAKTELEGDIRQLSRETAPDVEAWIVNAKAIQDDIEASRRLAGEIVQRATADEYREEMIREKQIYEEFLTKESAFNAQLLEALRLIEEVNNRLDQAEQLIEERRILDALRMLEDAWTLIGEVPAEKSTRAMRLLDQRSFELKATAHDHLMTLWKHLIIVDTDRQVITINRSLPSEPGTLEDAIIALKAYKELDQAALKLSQALNKVILIPRTDVLLQVLPGISISENSIASTEDSTEPTIKALFQDLEAVIRFLAKSLPKDIIVPLSQAMMPELSAQIKEVWLDAAVPSSLEDMVDYQKALAQVDDFAKVLKSLEWPGVDSFNDWVANAPKIWLAKRRETSLDWVRNGLSLGVGLPQAARKVETRLVAKEENPAANQDWDAAWNSDEEDSTPVEPANSNGRSRHSIDEEQRHSQVSLSMTPVGEESADDTTADAWGWGDDDDVVEDVGEDPSAANPKAEGDHVSQTVAVPHKQPVTPEIREVTMTEKYWTSSLPQPILKSVDQIFNDGARLLQPDNEHLPVAPAAAPLFMLPTLVLAMYRSVGQLYYGYHASGNLFLYNDTLWLADQLRAFVTEWKARKDIPSRAIALVRLDTDITVLESFGKRAYATEMIAQRTIINDLLGGTQNFFQDESSDPTELVVRINTVIDHIRSKASSWEQILSPSALSSSLGSLVNAVASRLINDVFDMSSMSVAEAESTATIISLVEKLDDLFLPKQGNGDLNGLSDVNSQIPLTAQFADQWMKMQFMCQTLQSNLNDIHYLWFESDLSLYFTAQEVIDLIELSFENNPQVRNQIRQIRDNPQPKSLDL